MKAPIISHIGTGAMALILAVIIWVFAYAQNQETVDFVCTVQCTAPDGVRVTIDKPTLMLSVRGPRRLVEEFRNRPPHVVNRKLTEENLAGLGDEGQTNIEVAAKDLSLDKRLVFDRLPTVVQAEFSRETTVQLPLRLRAAGSPRAGYVLASQMCYVQPPTVTVTGPKGVVEGAVAKGEAIYTEPLDITGVWQSAWWEAAPRPFIDSQPVRVEQSRARVWIAIEPKPETKTFDNVPALPLPPLEFAYKVSVKPATVSVTVEGPEDVLATIAPSAIKVIIELTASDRPQPLPYLKDPRALLPAGVVLKRIDPEKVDVTISAE